MMNSNGVPFPESDYKRVVGKGKDGNPVYQSISYTDQAGNTYTAQYNKNTNTYYAGSYSNADGVKQNASGSAITSADDSSVWVSVIESIQTFFKWLVSLFTGNREQINEKNTFPDQQTDGFVSESSVSWWIVLLLAGGALLYGMPKINGKTNSKKKSK